MWDLLTSRVLWTYGPLGAIAILEGVALWYIWSRHEELHKQHVDSVTKMKDEYLALVQSVEKTLDLLITVLSKSKKD